MSTIAEQTKISIIAQETSNLVVVTAHGKLDRAAYEQLVPEIEELTRIHGTIRLLVELVDFRGWTAGALWEDTKFAARHFSDIQRLAIVGDKQWEKGMAIFCKPFTRAEVRYFDRSDRGSALTWLDEGSD